MKSLVGLWIVAWLDVRSQPARTFAAIAGLIAAIVAVVVVDAAGILSQSANDEYISRTYGRAATLSIFPSGGASSRQAQRDQADQLMRHLHDNGVLWVSSDVDIAMMVVVHGGPTRTNVKWVSSTYPEVTLLELIAGDFPEVTATGDVLHAVISLNLARQLGFNGADAVGQVFGYVVSENLNLDFRTTPVLPMVIDAVASDSSVAFGTAGILVVSDLDRPDLLGEFFSRSWIVHVHPEDVALVTGSVDKVVDANGSPMFLTRRIDQGEQLQPLFDQQRVTARAVTLVALAIGGLGVFGIGLATVRERARDYGLRRALGASTVAIFMNVVIHALLEIFIATAIAVPAAALIVQLFARDLVLDTLPLPSSIGLPVASALQGFTAILIVGVAASLLPAWRAARSSVVQSIRN